jgi:hypothetical protein
MITFSYQLVERGWIKVNLTTEENEIEFDALNLSDAPYDLIIALTLLLEGESETVCSWQDEPGEYRWVFKMQENHLELKILELKETFSHQKNENAHIIFYGSDDFIKFVHRVLREFNLIKTQYTVNGYKNLWGHEFPLVAIEHLRIALNEKRN